MTPKPSPASENVWSVYLSLGGSIFGSVCWLLLMTLIARDWMGFSTVLLAAIVLFRWSTRVCLLAPQRANQVLWRLVLWLWLFETILVNLRWQGWIAVYRKSSWYDPTNDISLMRINLLLGGLFGTLFVMFLIRDRYLSVPQSSGGANIPEHERK